MAISNEIYISVDVETAGPNPSKYSLLSIGACHVFDTDTTFYIELKPDKEDKVSSALAISGLGWTHLQEHGLPPKEGMARFAEWVKESTINKGLPIFVAFNASFDWMFVNDYFQRYVGHNPFGHKALDIKSFYMGHHGVSWADTGMAKVSERYLENSQLSHHALQDALDQANIFRKMLGNDWNF